MKLRGGARAPGAISLIMLLLGGWSCTAFPEIPANECGNHVLDEKEDCDTFVDTDEQDETDAGHPKNLSCRPPGVPDACHFDCREDSDGKRYDCPTGLGCAGDGVCRHPTGAFDAKSLVYGEPTSWVSAADFDGDGRKDLLSAEPADQLQQARFRLHYFDQDSKLVETRLFPRFTTRPIPHDVTGDGTEDLIFSNLRIGMLPGRRDRQWVPAAFSSYVVPSSGLRVVPVLGDYVAGSLAIASISDIDGEFGIYVPDFTAAATAAATATAKARLGERLSLPGKLDDLVATPLAVDLIEGPGSPCAELVLAYRGARELYVIDMCEPGRAGESWAVRWRDLPLVQVFPLPGDLPVEQPPLGADVDGDGHLDVLYGSADRPYFVRGTGVALDGDVLPLEVARLDLPPGDGGTANAAKPLPMPIAAGDISGDGFADYVLPQSVLTSRPAVDGGVGHIESFPNRGAPWTIARIGDLNGNGLPDIVAASEGTPGLTFLNGTGGPYQIEARLPTQGAVTALGTGDYDGDLIDDVAFVEKARFGDETQELLAIDFGARDGVPLPPTRVAELEGVGQLGAVADAGMDVLFACTDRGVDGVKYSTVTLFDGSPDRLPFATYTLVDFSNNEALDDSFAPAIVLGAFTKAGRNDVVALGTTKDGVVRTEWLLSDIGGQSQPPRLLDVTLPKGLRPTVPQRLSSKLQVAGTAADLDGDGRAEALWLSPRDEDDCVLLIQSIDEGALAATQRALLELDGRCNDPELGVAYLDADEAPEILALVGDPSREPRHLEVFWNDGSGGFSLGRRSIVADPKDDDLRSFAVMKRLDEPTELVLVSERSLRLAKLGPEPRVFEPPRQLAPLVDGRSVVVTDPNGDGLSDIAVADTAGVWLLRAQLK